MSAVFRWNNQREVPFEPPKSLEVLLQQAGAAVELPCGGQGRCGKCRVRASGALSKVSERERRSLSDADLADGIRLSCMTTVLGDAEAFPVGASKMNILTRLHHPAVSADADRDELGIAVDIGTTTVVGYLFAPHETQARQIVSIPNPQSVFGADVISRIEKVLSKGSDALRRPIKNCLTQIEAELCSLEGIEPARVGDAVITGNTAMLYLLTGQNPAPLTAVPFCMDRPFGESCRGTDVGMTARHVYLPRCISAYVGADITCAMFAAGMASGGSVTPRTVLLADIGTNGEIVLAHQGTLYVCAAAAGPAFEGAGLEMGMTAKDGAICRVWVEDGAIQFETVGNQPARGLCGTGIVDAVAALLELEIIDETGCMDEDFVFPNTVVRLTRRDVRQVQLAKAAICAAMLALLNAARITPDAVESVIIAGGFGNAIRVDTAQRIGLLPQGFAPKARAIGNGAAAGAVMALLSKQVRGEMELAAKQCRVVELSTDPYWRDQYIEQMAFE